MPVFPEGPCLRCVFPEPPERGSIPTCDMSGVLGSSVSVAAAMEVTQLLRYFVEGGIQNGDHCFLTKMNLWLDQTVRIPVARDPGCPCCGRHEFPFLEAPLNLVYPLCGHGVIQISPTEERLLNLQDLKKRIDSMADSVTLRESLLEIKKGAVRILLFTSGRALVYGEKDPLQAKIQVEKYVG
jgi:adenylyltransferase/sulfurtransferase